MSGSFTRNEYALTALTLCLGGLCALIGYHMGMPFYPLVTPAIVLSLLSVTGMRLAVAPLVRDIAFIALGISIGSGITGEAIQSLVTWPLAFVLLFAMLLAGILAGTALLTGIFGFDRRSAVLSSSPGHLSYVLSIGLENGDDIIRITVIQSLRLLLLTLSVPLMAMFFGVDVKGALSPQGEFLDLQTFGVLFLASVVAGWIFRLASIPAAFFLAGMAVSSISHATELTPGMVPVWIMTAAFVVLGSIIGSRFSGITLKHLGSAMLAGVGSTSIAVVLACVFAVPAAYLVDMPWLFVLFAFAPGGLETMVILGAFLGGNPGFLAACHVIRLVILSFLVPLALARIK